MIELKLDGKRYVKDPWEYAETTDGWFVDLNRHNQNLSFYDPFQKTEESLIKAGYKLVE